MKYGDVYRASLRTRLAEIVVMLVHPDQQEPSKFEDIWRVVVLSTDKPYLFGVDARMDRLDMNLLEWEKVE